MVHEKARAAAQAPRSPFVVGVLHPAHIIRGAWAEEPTCVLYLKRVREIVEQGTWPVLDASEPPPNTILDADWTQLHNFYAGLIEECPSCSATGINPSSDPIYHKQSGLTVVEDYCRTCAGSGRMSKGVAVDIETAGPHITIIGMTRLRDYHTVVARFRRKGGDRWDDSWTKLELKVEVLFDILADKDIPKIFHNGQAFDVPRLEAVGFYVQGYYGLGFDTMLGSHICYPELPKDLEYTANVFAGLSGWKKLVRVEAEGEGK